MSVIIKTSKSLREIKKEWLDHQIKRDSEFLSRRDFLGKSAAGITALTFMPTLFSMMTQAQSAKAQEEFSKAAIILSLPGGYSHSAEACPLDVNGNFLTLGSYRNLGVPGQNPNSSGVVSLKYGAPLWTSQRLFKALEGASSLVKDNVKVVAGWHANSQDDSNNNRNQPGPHIIAAAIQAGARFRVGGTQLNSNSDAGGRGQPTAAFPGVKPAVASTLLQAQDLLTVKKGALAQMSTNSLVAATALAKKLTEGAAARFAAMNSGRQLAELTQVANNDLVGNVSSEVLLDPRADSQIATAFGINAQTQATDPRVPMAASTKLIADGLSPLMVAQLQANFDYHDGTSNWDAAGGAHALVVNTLIPILEACAAKRRSVIVMLSTDGATSFNESKIATGDRNDIHGALYIVLCMNGETPRRFLFGGMRSNDTAGGSADVDLTKNILQREPSYEGHLLTASLLGMQGLKPEDFAASSISIEDFTRLNFFKS